MVRGAHLGLLRKLEMQWWDSDLQLRRQRA